MNNKITINDLKYDELRIILKSLTVRQLFSCLTVSKRFQSIIIEILESQQVLTFLYNDINHYSKQELELMCSQTSHLPINSSIGRIIGSKAMISPFIRLDFSHIRDKFPHIINFCPNIKSLNLTQFSVKNSDIELILKLCPKLECLSITSNDTFWANILLNSTSGLNICSNKTFIIHENYKSFEIKALYNEILNNIVFYTFIVYLFKGLKHFSLSLTSKRYNGSEVSGCKPPDSPLIEELIIEGAITDSLSADILCSILKSISSKIIKFHFQPSNQMLNERVLDIIQALSGDEVNKSHIKNLNINVIVFKEMIEAIDSQLSSLEILHLRFNSQSNQSISLKNLKNLKEVHLNFNSNHDFGLRVYFENENSFQLSSLLPSIPSTVRKLSISYAFTTLSVLKESLNYLPVLQELELNFVCIEIDSEHNFWQVIASLKSLISLTLNLTNICDDGCEHLTDSQSLQTLELVKYKGPKAGETLISSDKIIETFGNLAKRQSSKWFTLRLDIDVLEVNDEIKRQIPRNMRILNVGFKK